MFRRKNIDFKVLESLFSIWYLIMIQRPNWITKINFITHNVYVVWSCVGIVRVKYFYVYQIKWKINIKYTIDWILYWNLWLALSTIEAEVYDCRKDKFYCSKCNFRFLLLSCVQKFFFSLLPFIFLFFLFFVVVSVCFFFTFAFSCVYIFYEWDTFMENNRMDLYECVTEK